MARSDSPAPMVPISFSNNFWGNDDRGVTSLLDRMRDAKQTCEELRVFYREKAAIEEEYAKKVSLLAKKSLGSLEIGTLRASLDTIRKEVEIVGQSHLQISRQIKSELEDPLASFYSSFRDRKKIISSGIDKQQKQKANQLINVYKLREKYEQDCQKVNSYVAQQNMLMGRELDKNNIKLEKTQLSVTNSNQEYANAIKLVNETTDKWNREWKAACDKFQDLEEERVDFLKSNLWTYANLASTVCVSDDESCERIRTALERCEVEKDIMEFIETKGTGQEIPEAPKYVNFYRGEQQDETPYSVAQFNRQSNPQFRSSTPQPLRETRSREMGTSPQPTRSSASSPSKTNHNEYPPDGMTMYCRKSVSDIAMSSSPLQNGPPSPSTSSIYSQPTTISSSSMVKGGTLKQRPPNVLSPELTKPVKKSSKGFLKSPFRRKSKPDMQSEIAGVNWSASPGQSRISTIQQRQTEAASPEPIDPRADVMLNVGRNMFQISPEQRERPAERLSQDDDDLDVDPIAAALSELNNVTRVPSRGQQFVPSRPSTPSSTRQSNNYPTSNGPFGRNRMLDNMTQGRNFNLATPPPATTAAEMSQTRQQYLADNLQVFGATERPQSRNGVSRQPINQANSYDGYDAPNSNTVKNRISASPLPPVQDIYRATSPSPTYFRSTSPHPTSRPASRQGRAKSPAPFQSRSDGPYGQYATRPETTFGVEGSRGGRTAAAPRNTSQNRSFDEYNYANQRAKSPAPQQTIRHRSRSSAARENHMRNQSEPLHHGINPSNLC